MKDFEKWFEQHFKVLSSAAVWCEIPRNSAEPLRL